MMERHTFAMKIQEGQLSNYRKILGEIWSDLKILMDDLKINNFSLWSVDLFVFGYCETAEMPIELTEELTKRITAFDNAFSGTYAWIS